MFLRLACFEYMIIDIIDGFFLLCILMLKFCIVIVTVMLKLMLDLCRIVETGAMNILTIVVLLLLFIIIRFARLVCLISLQTHMLLNCVLFLDFLMLRFSN